MVRLLARGDGPDRRGARRGAHGAGTRPGIHLDPEVSRLRLPLRAAVRPGASSSQPGHGNEPDAGGELPHPRHEPVDSGSRRRSHPGAARRESPAGVVELHGGHVRLGARPPR